MQSILSKLNKVSGVRGCMVVNKDGIVAASEFGIDVDENGIGAVASSILAALEAAVKRIKLGNLKRFLVTGDENKIAIVDTGPALLLVLLQRDANMGLINVELDDAAAAVVEQAKM
ncbi:MAG: roadblock/LC7 domain-containing protein [Planctomycetota bacterium]|nr:roadblock/LC7 domain-containing protein [Planctomycetota bacterium]